MEKSVSEYFCSIKNISGSIFTAEYPKKKGVQTHKSILPYLLKVETVFTFVNWKRKQNIHVKNVCTIFCPSPTQYKAHIQLKIWNDLSINWLVDWPELNQHFLKIIYSFIFYNNFFVLCSDCWVITRSQHLGLWGHTRGL